MVFGVVPIAVLECCLSLHLPRGICTCEGEALV